MEADFQIGHFLKDCVIPRAVLFYTGDTKHEFDNDGNETDSMKVVYKNTVVETDLEDDD